MNTNPSPETTVAIILGAKDFSRAGLESDNAFSESAKGLRNYLLGSSGMGLDSANVLNLFDDPRAPGEIDLEVNQFLSRCSEELAKQEKQIRDVIIYYTGHGHFAEPNDQYVLALKFTHEDNPGSSSYPVVNLATTLKRKVRNARRYVILDCCFASSAYQAFQTGVLQATEVQTAHAFANSGTSLLCASAPDRPAKSRLSTGSTNTGMTLFSESLLAVLEEGLTSVSRSHLSLGDIAGEIQDMMKVRWETEEGPRPELKSPDERRGDIALVPVFPNRAWIAADNQSVEGVVGAVAYEFSALLDQNPEDAPASLAPIIVAVEDFESPLEESELLRTERHMTVSLPANRIEELEKLGVDLMVQDSKLADIKQSSRSALRIFLDAQPRLGQLLERVRAAKHPQPIAWSGRAELLLRIYRAVLVAGYSDQRTSDDIVSVGAGDHYFFPIAERKEGGSRGYDRRIQARVRNKPARVECAMLDNLSEKDIQVRLVGACSADVVVIGAPVVTSEILGLIQLIKSRRHSRTRVVLGFGNMEVSEEFLDECLSRVPCVSLGGEHVFSDAFLECVERLIPTTSSYQAIQSVIAAVRRHWIRQTWEADDVPGLLDGLFWATWSWVGRPLFASEFGEIGEASYPHLTSLRSVATSDWYYNRREGIPDRYQANALTRPGSPEDKFHLYLTGAGGTGKSCFLRYVYEQICSRKNMLPVWYRVDAPSSKWDLVERRVREETALAVLDKLGPAAQNLLPSDHAQLSLYLGQLSENLRDSDFGIEDVVVFIDQLERTFESGDEPDFQNLEDISNEVIDLLKEIGVDNGVRVFIASRKQYLPDFLRSYEHASECGLHFNVLQTIGKDNERVGFVRKVLGWCQEQQLVAVNGIETDAAERLTSQVDGHPLEIMLALIHVLSQDLTGQITKSIVDDLSPWEKLFDFDLRLVKQDWLDWHFLKAMAHARAEIVGFEEVWWRLHLVDPELTSQLDSLERDGVLEWLWFRGHLGRTIHARPEGDDPAAFFEFFHANLRDYLLRDVMSWAGETPAAWRALDRLSAAAHDWEQTQQPLDADEVRALMMHRQFVVERTALRDSPRRDVFYLLFLRDAENSRESLCTAAKECFVFSALVHEESGNWAFQEIYLDVQDQIACCDKWLRRSTSQEHRRRIIQHLLDCDREETRAYLTTLVLAEKGMAHEDRWWEIANVLSQALYAARYRTDMAVAVLGSLAEESHRVLSLKELNPRFQEFLTQCCLSNRTDLLGLLLECGDRVEGLGKAVLSPLAQEFRSGDTVESWLEFALQETSTEFERSLWDFEVAARPRLELTVGEDLKEIVTEEAAGEWAAELVQRLGIPLSPFAINYVPDLEQRQELELRVHGIRIAVEDFFAKKIHVLMRHWEATQTFTPSDVRLSDNELMQETVLWMDPQDLRQTDWNLPMWTTEQAIVDWLELALRSHIDLVFDEDLLNAFMQQIGPTALDFQGISPVLLRRVVVNLVHEFVQVGPRWPELIEELQDVDENSDAATQSLREHLGTSISEDLADDFAQLAVIILDANLEKRLMKSVVSTPDGYELAIQPIEVHRLLTAVRRFVDRGQREKDVTPVIACERVLRFPLRRSVERFDPRVRVLSYTELSPELRLADAGMIDDWAGEES